MRAGRRLGVVLHGEHRQLAVPEPLDGAVVEVHVRDLESPARRESTVSSPSTAKPWFWDVISTRPVSISFTG